MKSAMLKRLNIVFVLCVCGFIINAWAQPEENLPASGEEKVVEKTPKEKKPNFAQDGPKEKPRMDHGRKNFGGPQEFHQMPPWVDIDKILADLKEKDPERYEALIRLRQEDREKFMQEMKPLFEKLHGPSSHKEIKQNEQQILKMAMQYKEAFTEEEKSVIKEKIESLVQKNVDLMIKDARQRLSDLEKQIQYMESSRDEIVKKQLRFFLHARKFSPKNEKKGKNREEDVLSKEQKE